MANTRKSGAGQNWPRPMPIVEVEWVDSCSRGRWSTPEQYDEVIGKDEASLGCKSAGYLYRRDRYHIVLLQSQASGGDVLDAIDIPRSAVRSLRVIEPVKKRH